MGWKSGVAVDPASGQVIVDTGPMPPSSRSAQVVVSATAATRLRYQHRNAANDATIQEQYLFCPANGTIVLPSPLPSCEFAMADQERLRVIVDIGLTGGNGVSASLFHPD